MAPIEDVISVKGTSSIDFISLTSTIFSPPFTIYNPFSITYSILNFRFMANIMYNMSVK